VDPDGQRHTNIDAVAWEVSVFTSYWLRNAQALQPGVNVALGLGVKVPTGKNYVGGTFWKADGTSVPFPVNLPLQLGDGSWGLILGVKGFRPVMVRSYLYGSGTYTANPKKTKDVVRSPGSTVHMASADTWDASEGGNTFG